MTNISKMVFLMIWPLYWLIGQSARNCLISVSSIQWNSCQQFFMRMVDDNHFQIFPSTCHRTPLAQHKFACTVVAFVLRLVQLKRKMEKTTVNQETRITELGTWFIKFQLNWLSLLWSSLARMSDVGLWAHTMLHEYRAHETNCIQKVSYRGRSSTWSKTFHCSAKLEQEKIYFFIFDERNAWPTWGCKCLQPTKRLVDKLFLFSAARYYTMQSVFGTIPYDFLSCKTVRVCFSLSLSLSHTHTHMSALQLQLTVDSTVTALILGHVMSKCYDCECVCVCVCVCVNVDKRNVLHIEMCCVGFRVSKTSSLA